MGVNSEGGQTWRGEEPWREERLREEEILDGEGTCKGVEIWRGLGKDMEFLVKFWELEWTVSEIAFMGQLFHMIANFCKRCEVYLAMDGGCL